MLLDEKPPLEGVYLAHFGTKGMKWGHRKARDTGSSSGSQPAKQKMSTGKKVAIGVAVTAGALAVAAVLRKRGKVRPTAFKGFAAVAANRDPSPSQMRMAAGMAAHRNAMQRVGSQSLTDKTWRDAARMSQMTRSRFSTPRQSLANLVRGRASVPDMTDVNSRLMSFTDQALRAGQRT